MVEATIIRAGFAAGYYVMSRAGRTPLEAQVSGPYVNASEAHASMLAPRTRVTRYRWTGRTMAADDSATFDGQVVRVAEQWTRETFDRSLYQCGQSSHNGKLCVKPPSFPFGDWQQFDLVAVDDLYIGLEPRPAPLSAIAAGVDLEHAGLEPRSTSSTSAPRSRPSRLTARMDLTSAGLEALTTPAGRRDMSPVSRDCADIRARHCAAGYTTTPLEHGRDHCASCGQSFEEHGWDNSCPDDYEAPAAIEFCRDCERSITRAADGAWESADGSCGCGDGEHSPGSPAFDATGPYGICGDAMAAIERATLDAGYPAPGAASRSAAALAARLGTVDDLTSSEAQYLDNLNTDWRD